VTSIANQPFDWQLLCAEIFYGTSCLNLEEHVFAYCSIVYNLYMMGHDKQKEMRRFSLLFSTLCTYSNYLRKINRKKHYIRFVFVSYL